MHIVTVCTNFGENDWTRGGSCSSNSYILSNIFTVDLLFMIDCLSYADSPNEDDRSGCLFTLLCCYAFCSIFFALGFFSGKCVFLVSLTTTAVLSLTTPPNGLYVVSSVYSPFGSDGA